jgi:galactose-1-phosphate uridylyltransferase
LGKTVLSYRLALELEIETWNPFRKTLQSKEDLEAFDQLMDMCRSNTMAGGAACRPVIFEAAVMTIMLSQTRRVLALEQQLTIARAKEAGLTIIKKA